MIRVVLDTNVVISSLLASGPPNAILDLAFNGEFEWYASKSILKEYETVLGYPRLKIDAEDRKRTMRAIRKKAQIVAPNIILAEAVDEEDNRFLECAQVSKANYLITGNLRHFPTIWKYTKVVAPRDFLQIWQFQKPVNRQRS